MVATTFHGHDHIPVVQNGINISGMEHHHHTARGHVLYCPNDSDCPIIDPVLVSSDGDDLRGRYQFGPADHSHDGIGWVKYLG